MNQLRQMAVFARIVESGSITAAAESLQLSKSVVSQHLKSLEQELGVLLLKRTTRCQVLTVSGQQFYEHCRELNLLADVAWRQVKESLQEPQGRVCITAPHALMGGVIAPAIGKLIQKYPRLKPELLCHDQCLDLLSNDIDLAIRVGASVTSNLKQKRIGSFRDVLCAQPALLQNTAIQQIPYIANHWQGQHITHRFVQKHGEGNFVFTRFAHCAADNYHACLALLQAGAGMGIIPNFLQQQQANLQEVFPAYQLELNNVYVLHPYAHLVPLHVQVCLEAIEQAWSE